MKTFGQRVRQARQGCGWTQKELANASGLTQSAIGNYESGQRTEPSGAALLKLAQALNISPVWLSQGKGAMDAADMKSRTNAAHATGKSVQDADHAGIWPFQKVRYESYGRLSPSDKRLLESLVATFIGSCSSSKG